MDHPVYRSMLGRRRFAQTMLALWVPLGVIRVITSLADAGSAGELAACIRDSTRPISNGVMLLGLIEIAYALAALGLLIATAVAFLMWTHRACANAHAIGAIVARHSPGFSVGCWFIPVANLYLPYRTMRDVWIASDPSRPLADIDSVAGGGVVGAWWGCLTATCLLGRIAGPAVDDATTVEEIRAAAGVSALHAIMAIATAILAWKVVGGISRRMEARAAALNDGRFEPGESGSNHESCAVAE